MGKNDGNQKRHWDGKGLGGGGRKRSWEEGRKRGWEEGEVNEMKEDQRE